MTIFRFSTLKSATVRLALGLATFGLASLLAAGASAQGVDIALSPLYAGATASPNVAISASFEFPTAGAAYLCSGASSGQPFCAGYNTSNGASVYSASNTYVGYFDPTKCYAYSGSIILQPDTRNPGVVNQGDPNGYFYVAPGVTGTPILNLCLPGLFNGNIMNWATMSALDEFRLALTGGNRDKETGAGAQSPNGGTIVQRAYLPGCTADITNPTIKSATNCSNTTNGAPSAVANVPDFYASVNLFPTVGPVTLDTGIVGAGVYINNCQTFMYVTTVNTKGNCTVPQITAGAVYNIRVSVCDGTEGPIRTDLCLQYPGGLYKPVGTVQRNAANMRFAVFGYLTDRQLPSGYTVPSNCQGRADGYAADPWNRCRAGGVLRAPMKYLGPLTYDLNGVPSTNNCAEINTNGTLVDDPEGNPGCPNGVSGTTVGGKYSGFINYINRFGSLLQASPPNGSLGGAGEYKRYDTMGEMYYEAIRYFMYKDVNNTPYPPTPETYQDQGTYTTTAARNQIAGYFPVLSSASGWPADPIVQQCAANYIVSISDTDTWDDTYLPGYAGSPAQNPANPANNGNRFRPTSRAATGTLDAYAWTKKIGALEATTTSLVANDVQRQFNATYPYSNAIAASTIQDNFTGSQGTFTATYFAAGAAYWANTNEIRPDLPALPNNQIHSIKTISIDTGGQDRPVWDRQLYLMGKYGGFNYPNTARSDGTQANPFFATNPANPGGPGTRSNSEWEDAPGSGYPANYLRASSPQKLITGLQAVFANINASSGSAAGGAVTSTNLSYGAAGTYVSQFSPARWSGTVLNETVSSVNGTFTVNTTPVWDSGKSLTTRCGSTSPYSTICTDASITTTGNRNIVTTVTSASGVRSGVNFTLTNLAGDTNYTRALNVNPTTGTIDNQAQQRVNYLRGYRGDEASSVAFRVRDSVMGDIINSAPIYVGPPSSGITDTAYQAFFASNALRTAAVYVGANDGMMHAFDATTGAELFAYIPGLVSSYLGDLTNPGYAHEPFVDAIPTVQEAKVRGTYKTVLVSGAGGGAQGVFALDVTDPTAFDPTKVLFEFSDADDVDFGNVLSAPAIVKLQTGTSPVAYGYFAAVTTYNNRRPQCKSPGNLSLLTTLLGGLGAALNAVPACSSNSQGDAYVQADALNQSTLYLLSLDHQLGTAWTANATDGYYKFYFPAISKTSRNGLGPVAALPSSSGDGTAAALYFGDLQGQMWRFNTIGAPSTWAASRLSGSTPAPIFVATSSGNVAQPITARPEIATGPFGSTLVIFGTGAYLGQTDVSASYTQQTEYVLIDSNGSTLINRNSDLQSRTATFNMSNGQVTGVNVTGSPFSYGQGSSKKGWYLDFPSSSSSGERMVNKAAVAPGLLTFTSLTLAGSVCGSGSGYVYQVNPLTGLPLSGSIGGYTSTVGIPGPPAIVDLSVSAGVTRPTGEQINQKTRTTLVSGTSGGIAGIGTPPATKVPPVGRVNWREITNYNDRH